MDTTDTTTTDLVIIDAEILEDDSDEKSELAKTAQTAAATSAVIVLGYLAYSYIVPAVTSWFSSAETPEIEVMVHDGPIPDAPETEKV